MSDKEKAIKREKFIGNLNKLNFESIDNDVKAFEDIVLNMVNSYAEPENSQTDFELAHKL